MERCREKKIAITKQVKVGSSTPMFLLAEFEYTACSAKMGYFLLLRIVLISEDFFVREGFKENYLCF